MQIETVRDGEREVVRSDDNRMRYTLATLPSWARADLRAGYERFREELADEVRSYEAGPPPFRPAEPLAPDALKLPKSPKARGFRPKVYGIGDWITWQPQGEDGPTLHGQVWSQAPKNTFYVVTDRSAITGEYHVMRRERQSDGGYLHWIGAAPVTSRSGEEPEQLPFDPAVELAPGAVRPAPPGSYAAWFRKGYQQPARPADAEHAERRAARRYALAFPLTAELPPADDDAWRASSVSGGPNWTCAGDAYRVEPLPDRPRWYTVSFHGEPLGETYHPEPVIRAHRRALEIERRAVLIEERTERWTAVARRRNRAASMPAGLA